jgi:hypothetical protein
MEHYDKTLDISPGQPVAPNNLAYLMVENGGYVGHSLEETRPTPTSKPPAGGSL